MFECFTSVFPVFLYMAELSETLDPSHKIIKITIEMGMKMAVDFFRAGIDEISPFMTSNRPLCAESEVATARTDDDVALSSARRNLLGPVAPIELRLALSPRGICRGSFAQLRICHLHK